MVNAKVETGSIRSTEAGVNKQNFIRAPLFVLIVSVVVIMTSVIGAVVGYLTLTNTGHSINDITNQMRLSILDRSLDSVNATLTQTIKNALQYQTIEAAGVLFQQDAAGNSDYLAAYPRWGQIYFQDRSTNFTLRSSRVESVGQGYSLQLNTTVFPLVRSDWIPNLRFANLGNNGIVPGRPFFTAAIYTPVVRTFLLPLMWPMWQNRPLGVVGPGNYWAAHFCMLSIKTLDDFLQTVTTSKNGVVALIDGSNGLMLASSIAGISQNGTQNSRFTAIGNPNNLVTPPPPFSPAPLETGLGDEILVNAAWIRDETTGLKWLLVLAMPSDDFLSVIKGTTRFTIIFIVCTCVAAAVLAALLSWAISAPLMTLAKTMMQATQFDFSALSDGYLDKRSSVTEIGRVQGVFNEMMIKFAGAIKSNNATGNSYQRPGLGDASIIAIKRPSVPVGGNGTSSTN
ncbi:hypothetical protein BC829DRAFT_490711 [Chytridium lagenaria]|nr:hypothetical protein BC829DRAFT_490711 [Chytridium lagenaria]